MHSSRPSWTDWVQTDQPTLLSFLADTAVLELSRPARLRVVSALASPALSLRRVSGDENPQESGDCHRQGRLPASAGIWC